MPKLLTFIFLVVFCVNSGKSQFQTIPMEEESWEINGQKFNFTTKEGQKSLYLERSTAIAKAVNFKNGIIEFDILFPESRKFVGFIWRIQDNANYEEFYLRPHQSGNPDANQYTPVFNGNSAWQLYHGEGYGQPFAYNFDEWMHVKIIFKDADAEFYINDMETPLFRAYELKHSPKAGQIGFRATGPEGGAYFANLQYRETDDIEFKAAPIEKPAITPETIPSWQISGVFPVTALDGITKLSDKEKGRKKWQKLEAENTGTINISRLHSRTREVNTVFAKCVINSTQEQVKKLNLGYSDAIHVFCNDQLLYSGDNSFQSRDYRYLGTIGYFDGIYLPLKRGKNEIWIAVTEGFGGWGIKGKFEDLEGLKIITEE